MIKVISYMKVIPPGNKNPQKPMIIRNFIEGVNRCGDKGLVTSSRQIIEADNTINKTYNLTKSHSNTLFRAAQLAISLAQSGYVEIGPRHPDFPSRGSLDITQAKKDFDFSPRAKINGLELIFTSATNGNELGRFELEKEMLEIAERDRFLDLKVKFEVMGESK